MSVRVGIVGVGGIGSEHVKNLHADEQAELAAVCDLVRENAERVSAATGAAVYTDYDEMLDREKLDALFLCVPPFAHGEMEEKAAARGIHLFVEKPVGLDMDTVNRKAEAMRASGIIVGTGYCLRYLDTVARAKEYLQDKKIAMARAHRFGGFVPVLWWRDIAKSGGQLVEQTTHNLDLLRYLAGEVTRVSADMALTVMDDIPGITIPDVYSVNLRFASGAVGHLDTSFVDQPDGRSSLEIIGRGFRLTLDGTTLTIREKDRTLAFESRVNFLEAQDRAFVEAVRTGDRSLILAPYEEAAKTLAVSLGAHASADTGAAVAFE